ncbi:MAG: hypothetical protein R3A51_17110 [Nannocystaceae bacterium]
MELLVVIAAELLAAVTLAGALVGGALALSVLLFLSECTWSLIRGRRPAPARGRGRAARRGLVALFVVIALALALLQTALLEPLARRGLASLAARGGPQVAFERLDAAVWRGRARVEGLTITPPGAAAPLRVRAVEIDVELRSLAGPRLIVDALVIEGLSGQLARGEGTRARGAARAPFVLRSLALRDAALTLVHGEATRQLTLESARVSPLRSDHALEDLLFRSEARGAVDSIAFSIERGASGNTWSIKQVPTAALSGRLDGFARWITGGGLSLTVETVAPAGGERGRLDFAVSLRGVRLEAPADADRRARLAAAAVTQVIAARAPLTLAFTVFVDPEVYRGARSLADVDLVAKIAMGLSHALRAQAGARSGPARPERPTRPAAPSRPRGPRRER